MSKNPRSWYYPTIKEIKTAAKENNIKITDLAEMMGVSANSLYSVSHKRLGVKATRKSIKILEQEGSLAAKEWYIPSGKQVYEYIEENNIKHSEVAFSLDSSRSTVYNFGEGHISVEKILDLRKAFIFHEENGYFPCPSKI